jgi:hypothetical protein
MAVKEFLYGGVGVWRLRGDKRERRTLWLYDAPMSSNNGNNTNIETTTASSSSSSLKLGFVSKLSNLLSTAEQNSNASPNNPNPRLGGGGGNRDNDTVASEELTLDSALLVVRNVDDVMKHLTSLFPPPHTDV